jgi:hypothetical protein
MIVLLDSLALAARLLRVGVRAARRAWRSGDDEESKPLHAPPRIALPASQRSNFGGTVSRTHAATSCARLLRALRASAAAVCACTRAARSHAARAALSSRRAPAA